MNRQEKNYNNFWKNCYKEVKNIKLSKWRVPSEEMSQIKGKLNSYKSIL